MWIQQYWYIHQEIIFGKIITTSEIHVSVTHACINSTRVRLHLQWNVTVTGYFSVVFYFSVWGTLATVYVLVVFSWNHFEPEKKLNYLFSNLIDLIEKMLNKLKRKRSRYMCWEQLFAFSDNPLDIDPPSL